MMECLPCALRLEFLLNPTTTLAGGGGVGPEVAGAAIILLGGVRVGFDLAGTGHASFGNWGGVRKVVDC